jgi:hypothetical protein
MGWQRHTVRGFMADAMKKAGYTVEWFKPENGERTYRLNAWHRILLRPTGSGRGGLFASGPIPAAPAKSPQPWPPCPDLAAGVSVRQAWRNGSQSSA